MFYLIQKDGAYTILEREITRSMDADYNLVEKQVIADGGTLHGQFGRLDYAKKWRDFYNSGGYKVNGALRI